MLRLDAVALSRTHHRLYRTSRPSRIPERNQRFLWRQSERGREGRGGGREGRGERGVEGREGRGGGKPKDDFYPPEGLSE